jgi:hypothetical protein
MVTMHAPAPVQSPDHPPNVEPTAADADSITMVPAAKVAEHVVPQLIPVGLEVTVPVPVPPFMTTRLT